MGVGQRAATAAGAIRHSCSNARQMRHSATLKALLLLLPSLLLSLPGSSRTAAGGGVRAAVVLMGAVVAASWALCGHCSTSCGGMQTTQQSGGFLQLLLRCSAALEVAMAADIVCWVMIRPVCVMCWRLSLLLALFERGRREMFRKCVEMVKRCNF